MTEQQIAAYLRGEVKRDHAVNPMVVHGEINAPAFLVTNTNVVHLHVPAK